MSSQCIICFDEDLNSIQCTCNSVVCKNCFNDYLKFCNENNQLPKCPNTECNLEILFSKINMYSSKEDLENYIKICCNKIQFDTNDIIGDYEFSKKLWEKIRKEKMDFIINNVPASVKYIIEVSMQKKLKSIISGNIKYANEKLQKLENIKCPLENCNNGRLDKIGKCIVCGELICKNCLKQKNKGHKCKNEDLENIKFMKKIIKCPKCHIPIIKREGCDNMTCSVCNTNFNYITGKVCVPGNHGQEKITVLKDQKLSEKVGIKSKFYIDILNIENSISLFKNKLINLSIELNETENKMNIMYKMAKHYEKIILNNQNNYKINQKLDELNEQFNNNIPFVSSDFI